MAKRFQATEIWDEDWFLDMPDAYKLFWNYMLAKCDHGGLFRVNVSKFNRSIADEKKVNPTTALEFFNAGKDRIRVVSESKWLIEDFFVFQYGQVMNLNNKVHASIETLYNQSNVSLTSIRGLKDLKLRSKEKDKEKDIDFGKSENLLNEKKYGNKNSRSEPKDFRVERERDFFERNRKTTPESEVEPDGISDSEKTE